MMKSSKISNLIISNNINNSKLDNLFRSDFDKTIKEIYLAIYELLLDYKVNEDKIIYLIDKIEENIKDKSDEKLDTLLLSHLVLSENISNNFSNREQKKIAYFTDRLHNIVLDINNRQREENSNNLVNLFNYLVYDEKNLYRLKVFLDNYSNTLKGNKLFNNSFDNIFTNFTNIDINNKEYEYYYHVILLTISEMDSKYIAKNKNKYLDLLYTSSNRKEKSIKTLISILMSEYVSNQEKIENKYGINIDYPESLEHHAYNYTSSKEKRDNLFNQSVITIDSPNTMRVDDGIFIERNKDGSFTMYVHISDVPSVIPFSSILTEEAYHRAENIYFRDNIMNIYPEYISTNLLSLIPNNKRNVMTFKIDLDNNMDYLYDTFSVSLNKIIVDKKMNYDEVSCKLNKDSESNYKDMLELLFLFAYNNLHDKKLDVDYLLSNHKELQDIIRYSRKKNIGQVLVQEAMKTTGYLTSKLMNELELPFIYKSYYQDNSGLDNIMDILKNYPELEKDNNFVNKIIRSYSKSYYTSVPKSFNNYECYAGVTDPLWKFADSYNLYMIHDYLLNGKEKTDIDFYNIAEIATELNKRINRNLDFRREYELSKTLEKKSHSLRRKK